MNRNERRLAQKKQKTALVGKARVSVKNAEKTYYEAAKAFQQGNFIEAAQTVSRLLKALPTSIEALQLAGLIELSRKNHLEAVRYFQKGLAVDPNLASFSDLLGTAYSELGQFDDAVVAYRRALLQDQKNAAVLNNLGIALIKTDDLEAAEKAFTDSLIYRPKDLTTSLNLAEALILQEKYTQAEAIYRASLNEDKTFLQGYHLLGDCLMQARKWQPALELAAEAISLGIAGAEIYTLKGSALRELLRFDEAIVALNRALELESDRASALDALSVLYFYQENWSSAWKCYEARWRSPTAIIRTFPQPLWQGEPLSAKHLLIWSEQGVGDEILFATMFNDLLTQGAKLAIESDPRLIPMFERSFPTIKFIPRLREQHPDLKNMEYDFQIPLGSLGQYLRNTEPDFGTGSAFLKADDRLSKRLKAKYANKDDLLVGLAWYSSAQRGVAKSIPLQDLRPLFEIENVQFVDLQYGDRTHEREALKNDYGVEMIHDDDIDQMKNLDDFAAQIAAMDLVISVSNTTVHLAGALGVPTWVLLPGAPIQRWLLNRSDSPWYKSVELFRQQKLDDWQYVVDQVRDRLMELQK